MFGSQALELFIALVTLMFILSLASSTVVEAGASLIRRRGKKLEESLARLLGLGEPKRFSERVFKPDDAQKTGQDEAPKNGPDEAQRKGIVQARVRAAQTMNTRLVETEAIKAIQTKSERFPSYISPETFLDMAKEVAEMEGEGASSAKERLKGVIGDSAAAKEGREKLLRQFNEAMERLGNAYKRRTGLWLFVVGLFIAVAANASIYNVTRTLWSDTVAREAVVEAAKNVGGNEAGIEAEDLKDVGATVDQLADLGLPVGWTDQAKNDWGPKGELSWTRVGMVGGWVATAALVTLGAPFWFDLLNKTLRKPTPPAGPGADDKRKT